MIRKTIETIYYNNHTSITMVLLSKIIDFQKVREERQNETNNIVSTCLLNKDIPQLYPHINIQQYKRSLKGLNMTEEGFLSKCADDLAFRTLASQLISKRSSRQGTKDESKQMEACNYTGKNCGIRIENLSSTALRPTKNGGIVTKQEMIDKAISKDDTLKSFDGRITGNLTGYISCKVVYSSGGHQDNVFAEMDELAHWWTIHKPTSTTEEILVILIDTDLDKKFSAIKNKYVGVDNVLIFNHVEFQQYMISKFYSSESM